MTDDRQHDDPGGSPPGGSWAPFGPSIPSGADDEERREQQPPPFRPPGPPVFQPPSPPVFQPPPSAPPPVSADQPPPQPPPQTQPPSAPPAYGPPMPPPPGYGAPPPAYGPPMPPPPGYGPPPPYAPPPYLVRKTNGLAVASLIVSVVGFWIYGLGSILGLIFGYIAKSQIDKSGGMQDGRGLAIAGIVIGWIGVGIGAILIVAIAASS